VVELAGLSEHCDFDEQVHVKAEGGAMRPDMVVHLPGERDIVVDAKVSLAAYLDALEATRPEDRNAALLRHAAQLRQHMSALSSKAYAARFSTSLDLVVMFVPGEAFVAAAVEQDRTLLEDGLARGVVVATPTTLVVLLRAIAYGWKQERLARSAVEIRDLGRELYERLRTLAGHLDRIGATLGQSVRAYNDAVGSLELRVLPKAREFRELGAGEGDEIRRLKGVEQVPRPLAAPELTEQLSMPEAGAEPSA
jgi:DNA recombination protein RmuC